VDVWSSVYTWGGGPLPEEGDLVEIPQGQTLLLDMDTPVLKVLLIRGVFLRSIMCSQLLLFFGSIAFYFYL